jgi:hypothetical protein
MQLLDEALATTIGEDRRRARTERRAMPRRRRPHRRR